MAGFAKITGEIATNQCFFKTRESRGLGEPPWPRSDAPPDSRHNLLPAIDLQHAKKEPSVLPHNLPGRTFSPAYGRAVRIPPLRSRNGGIARSTGRPHTTRLSRPRSLAETRHLPTQAWFNRRHAPKQPAWVLPGRGTTDAGQGLRMVTQSLESLADGRNGRSPIAVHTARPPLMKSHSRDWVSAALLARPAERAGRIPPNPDSNNRDWCPVGCLRGRRPFETDPLLPERQPQPHA